MSSQYPEAAMTSDLEVIRVAASLIREHGGQARSCTHKWDSRIGRLVIQASKLWELDHERTL